MIIREIVVWLWGSPEDKDHQRSRLYYRWKDFKITGTHLFLAYCLVGLFTFGYSASNYPVMGCENWGYCSPEMQEATKNNRDNFSTAFQSTVAAVCWPAYWTWEIMDDGTATR